LPPVHEILIISRITTVDLKHTKLTVGVACICTRIFFLEYIHACSLPTLAYPLV